MGPIASQFARYFIRPAKVNVDNSLSKMGKALNVANTVKGSNVNPQKRTYAPPDRPFDWAKD